MTRMVLAHPLFAGLIFVLFLSSAANAATYNFSSKKAETPSRVLLEKPLASLVVGEKLRFDVNWMGVYVGFGEIEVKQREILNGREAYHIVAVAQTNEVLSILYPVRDEIHSWIDAENFHSLKFRKILREGRYRADEEVEYDPARKKAFYRSNKNGTRKEFAIGGLVHDMISAFYWFRLQHVPPGQSISLVVNSEEKDWDAQIQVLSFQKKTIRGLGEVETICVEPKTSLKGVLYSRGRAWVYFTADKRRTPVWVLFKTPFGPISGVLKIRT